MPSYDFLFHDGRFTPPERMKFELFDRDAAVAYARSLLADRPRFEVVEISEDGELVEKIIRTPERPSKS